MAGPANEQPKYQTGQNLNLPGMDADKVIAALEDFKDAHPKLFAETNVWSQMAILAEEIRRLRILVDGHGTTVDVHIFEKRALQEEVLKLKAGTQNSPAGKVILDACCGSRMFWFDKNHPLTLFADIRREDHILCDGRKIEIDPDVISDFRAMPFEDRSFKLVVFDPPHLKGAGSEGWQAKKYGSLAGSWKEDLKQGFNECMRVLDTHGVLIFKWNEHSIKVSEVVKEFGVTPLFGHRTGQSSKTMWMAFMKTENEGT